MKAKLKRIEKVILTMTPDEAAVLKGLLNHGKITSINPILYEIYTTLDEAVNMNEKTYAKTIELFNKMEGRC